MRLKHKNVVWCVSVYMAFGCHQARFTLALTVYYALAVFIGSNKAICIINVLENSRLVQFKYIFHFDMPFAINS